MNYLKSIEKAYLRNQKEKIISLARELISKNEITSSQLVDTYYYLYINNNYKKNKKTPFKICILDLKSV